ncbi:MAG: hypothetical protein AAGD07_24545 [Planctomycetota bacterium]
MFSVMTLLVMASAAVTYGWTSDGKDGLRYIVQIPPSQWDQVRSAGNLRCVIAPEVQGRVTEIVVRLGHGDVPRDTPPNDSDHALIPVPQITSPAGAVKPTSATTALKPAPQDAAMSLPNAFPLNNLPETINQQARDVGDAAAVAGNQLRDAVRGAAGQLGISESGFGTSALAPGDPRARLAPSTAPTQARESSSVTGVGGATQRAGDWFDLNERRNSLPTTAPTAPGFGRVQGSNDALSASNRQQSSTNDARSPSMPATSPATSAPGLGMPSPSTVRAGAASSGLPGGFGQFPNGVGGMTQPNPNASTQPRGASQNSSVYANTTPNSSSVAYDPQLTPAQAQLLPPNGYTFDRQWRPMDREGYLLDAKGNRVDQRGNLINPITVQDPRSRLAGNNTTSTPTNNSQPRPGVNFPGIQGDPIPTNRPTINSPLAGTNPQVSLTNGAGYPNAYATNGNQGGFLNTPTAPMDPRLATLGQSTLGGSMLGLPNNGYPTSRYPGFAVNQPPNVNTGSSAATQKRDATIRSEDRVEANQTNEISGAKASVGATRQKMDAQPIFNGLLLISIVANLYLLRWLQNMRSHFRDLVASKRAAGSVA